MKFTISFVALAAALLCQTTAAASISNAAEECGALGVMEVPEVLPEGVVASDIRKCATHPLEANGGISRLTNGSSIIPDKLEARKAQACEFDAPYGCSGGFCWKVCGNGGQWCWTAANNGLGSWNTCSSFKDCEAPPIQYCGQGCGEKCGCSC